MTEKLLAGQASVWVQPDGPNTEPKYLGCHEVGDVDVPHGDTTLLYCPDPAKAGAFKVDGSYREAPGVPTTSLTTHVAKTADWLEGLECPAAIFVHKVTCGRRDLFANYDRSFIFHNAVITNEGLSNLAARNPDAEGESMQSFDISFEALLRILLLNSARQGIADTYGLAAIASCGGAKCADDCGPAKGASDYMVAAGLASASPPAAANVYVTVNGGQTWVADADPFAVGEDIGAIACFPMTRDVTRILVARGTADAGNPAEVAYSDDDGATWTVANVGTTNGQYVTNADGMFALDLYHIWLVTNDGYIYFSADGGGTWTTQDAGVTTVNDLNAVKFVDGLNGYAAGESNTVLKTADGGTAWTLLTAPVAQAGQDVLALGLVSKDVAWIGYDDGALYYTMDGGLTWGARTGPWTGGEIESIGFVNPLVGFMLHNASGPLAVVYRTIDGGYTWEMIALPANDGAADLLPISVNEAFVVGAVSGGTAFVGKVFA